MITLTITSETELKDLRLARTILDELTARREVVLFEEAKGFKASHKTDITVKVDASEVQKAINEAVEDLYVNGTSTLEPRGIFTPAELAESEALGKPVCSTVDAEASTTAHVDTTDNTSLPAPTSVFGQPAQTVASEVNPVAPATEAPALDVDGLPWDERIHSSSKERNANGTWRRRRGVSDEVFDSVQRELRGEPLAEMTHAVAIPPNDPVVVNATEMTFNELLDAITKAMVSGQLKQVQINEALQSLNLQALPFLINKPELIPAFRTALGGIV